jgi:hypothetical protein
MVWAFTVEVILKKPWSPHAPLTAVSLNSSKLSLDAENSLLSNSDMSWSRIEEGKDVVPSNTTESTTLGNTFFPINSAFSSVEREGEEHRAEPEGV